MKREMSLPTAIEYLKSMLEKDRRVFGENHKTVQALNKVVKYVEGLQDVEGLQG